MPVTIDGTTGVTTPGATVGAITGILKATSGVVSQAVAGTDYLTSTSGGAITLATAQTASGTSIDFTSIPAWVKRITVMFNAVSTNGTSNLLFQIGAGSVSTSGYTSFCNLNTNIVSSTAGFIQTFNNNAAQTHIGSVVLSLLSANTWVSNGQNGRTSDASMSQGCGSITLGGTLDRIRLTTVGGTDTFDAGTINISYE